MMDGRYATQALRRRGVPLPDEPRPTSVALAWASARVHQAQVGASDSPAEVPRRFRALFAEGDAPHHVPERFDDRAARVYYEANDPRVTGDQERAIRQLLARRRQPIGTPLVTAYEEQDPHYGRWTMSLLAYGEYGDFKLANNSYIHINNPPVTIPPRVLRIHVCWGTQFHGAATASTLHGVVALLVDDLRAALRAVPVVFHLHCLGPAARSGVIGRGGRRWRDRKLQRIPKAHAVAMLFERANRARAVEPWVLVPEEAHLSPRAWWLACLLEAFIDRVVFRLQKSV
jgi:hypothetical protein